MWQVLIAAAVAGSGLIAQHFSIPTASRTTADNDQPQPVINKQQQPENPVAKQISPHSPTTPLVSNPSFEPIDHASAPDYFLGEEKREIDDSVFKFSSSESGNQGGFRFDSKKSRVLGRNFKFQGVKKNFVRSGRDRSHLGKKVVVCLKKRKTGRCDGSCCTKDSSLFNSGLGLGIAYMMSASKAELNKLSTAVDETTKVVLELKSELCKRKSSHHEPSSSVPCPDHSNKEQTQVDRLLTKPVDVESSRLLRKGYNNDINSFSPCITDDGEYASSVLTEEPRSEGMEMDQLEAELESELQKLPWCANGASDHVESRRDNNEMQGFQETEDSSNFSDSCINGVSPYVLNQKLSSVLIKQQESYIMELETELALANSKLQEKESELQALKDCVRRLTEFSLSTASDDETEACAERGSITKQGNAEDYGSPSPTGVGKKRGMDFGAYSC